MMEKLSGGKQKILKRKKEETAGKFTGRNIISGNENSPSNGLFFIASA
jgi:hypothetical protein